MSLKKIKAQKNKIIRNQTQIRKANADILINQNDQLLQKEVITKQEIRVAEFEVKLSSIK